MTASDVDLDILKRTIAIKLWPDIAHKPVSYPNTVELIVRVVLQMKKEGAL